MPEAVRSIVEPLLPSIVAGIHQAYSIAVGSVFQIGVLTTIAALIAALVMRELPLRTTAGHGPNVARDPQSEGERAAMGSPATAPAPD